MYLQEHGSHTLREPEIVEWLGLTVAQQRQILSVYRQRSLKMKALLDEWEKLNGMTRAVEFQDQKKQIDDERNRNALDVLTEAQRAKYDDLVGKPVAPAKPTSSGLK